jgi:hypothetical protein
MNTVLQRVQVQKASIYSFPAPVGGLNTRDSLDNMPETDAVVLDNLFPGFGQVSTRFGSTSYATGLGGPVYTLAEFNAGDKRKFIAAAAGQLWDISAPGPGVSLATDFDGEKWQWAQFDDAGGGARMGLVNGVDAPQIYNGSGVSAMTVSGSGLTASSLIGINIYKNRSYFWEVGSQNFWYSATNALGGTLTKFPLGRVQGTGGNLVFMATWTRDAGNGMDDLAVFALTSGDVLIYQGSNPADATDFGLIGRYSIGAPLSIRGYENVGGDLWVITRSGYIPMSKVLDSGRAKEAESAVSSQIRGSVLEAILRFASNYGWQAILYPKHSLGTCCIFNIPLTAKTSHQHVINVATGAWCRFKGMNAKCWGAYNDGMYFGGEGVVYRADSGASDAGAAINYVMQPSWNYLKKRSTLKQATMARFIGTSTGAITYTVKSASDFGPLTVQAQGVTQHQGIGGDWDTSEWDTTSWPAEQLQYEDWYSIGSIGYNFGVALEFVSSTDSMSVSTLALAYQEGGIL